MTRLLIVIPSREKVFLCHSFKLVCREVGYTCLLNQRELLLILADNVLPLLAIDFSELKDGKTHYTYKENSTTRLAECPYFTTNLIPLTKPLKKDFNSLDSFVIYLCVEGIAAVKSLNEIVPIHAGECVLVPAVADTVELFSEGPAKLLEVYIDPEQWTDKESHNHSTDRDWLAQFVGNAENL